MRDELMHWLVPRFGEDLELDYDRDRISALAERRRQVWERVQRADFLTINERRAEVGFGPIPGGDVLVSATKAGEASAGA